MLKKWMFLSLIVVCMLSACQTKRDDDANGTAYDLRKDRSAPNMMSIEKDKRHGDVVEDDVTDRNPNFLNLNRSFDRGEYDGLNNGSDVDKATKVINGTKEFAADSVWINGDRMWVSAYKKGMLSDRERIDAEARLHRKLTQALPRYNIEVRVKEDRR